MKTVLPMMMLALSGCASEAPSKDSVGVANPASIHCAVQGGRIEIRKEPGGETGYCHLSDGRVVEEWELYRSRNEANGG